MKNDEHLFALAQLSLRDQGLYDGEIDGLWGEKTEKGYREFKKLNPVIKKNFEDDGELVEAEPSREMNIEIRDQLKARGRHAPRKIILHHTNGYFETSMEYLDSVGYGYHYLIDFDGKIVRCVPPDQLCYHAKKNNTGSIGIAFNGDTNTGELRPHAHLTDEEANAAASLILMLKEQFPAIKSIVTHHEVDPKRKWDTSDYAKYQILKRLEYMERVIK